MRWFGFLFVVWTSIAVVAWRPLAAAPLDVDILLQGGTVVDGTGGEPYVGDVAVRGDKIVAVGNFEVGTARRTIDCQGLVVCPGFIDLHNHSDDDSILKPEARDARCYLTQGCTTLVTGNCGGGQGAVGKYYDRLAADGAGINIAHLIPQGEIRSEVMGKVRRAPTDEELKKMQELVAVGMEQGAWGMSTGLQYVPSAMRHGCSYGMVGTAGFMPAIFATKGTR
jgi:N-acyl-D-aspartate/D-glutamate deacylase